VLMSSSVVGDTCTGRLVLRVVHELLTRALLPVGRRWVSIKKLEAQAVIQRWLAPDALQTSALQLLNRLCRVHPPACEAFRDIALHCTDTFHLSITQQTSDGLGTMSPLPRSSMASAQGPLGLLGTGGSSIMDRPLQAGSHRVRQDNTLLYAEILDFLATLCARGSMHNAHLVCQKLLSHSNQWFNWGFLLDVLAQHARAQPSFQMLSAGGAGSATGTAAPPVAVALCRLLSGACGSRLL
ncbi:unnamed protein product, partial [Polarella glacialis]